MPGVTNIPRLHPFGVKRGFYFLGLHLQQDEPFLSKQIMSYNSLKTRFFNSLI